MTGKMYSLLELNSLVRSVLADSLPERYWVHAELSEVHANYSGHCYVEFVEKDSRSDQIIAKARGIIWAPVFRLIKEAFEQETGQVIIPGLKVLVQVSVVFHELYGYSLTVHDIDPVYTLGDVARRRREVLRSLEEDGVADMNKELKWVPLPQRIAVISSPTAAGYGDFMNQLHHNKYGYRFYTVLFPAVMQGTQTEESVIDALNRIHRHLELFDGVVIIRGGGATSDLSSFDSYLLASNVAQFPLPVITGIGHERDDTVIDCISNVRVKTPTAAAEWLINRVDETARYLNELQISCLKGINDTLSREKAFLQKTASAMPVLVERRINGEKNRLVLLYREIPEKMQVLLRNEKYRLERSGENIRNAVKFRIEKEKNRLDMMWNVIDLISPESVLRRGYSITLKDGKVINSVKDAFPGDKLETWLADGRIESNVEKIKKDKR